MNRDILSLAKNLMLSDGIMPSGIFVNKPYPECRIRNVLSYQESDIQIKSRRKYRKIRKFIKKKYRIGNVNILNMSKYVKMYYMNKARILLLNG